MRTLEMKIADAGPLHLRVDPHILTRVRTAMVKAGHVRVIDGLWYHRAITPRETIQQRLSELRPLYRRTNDPNFKLRLGQTLEIAILKALESGPLEFVGGFLDLADHDDSTLYRKEEPPLRFSGQRMPGDQRFDFLAFHPTAGRIGIEAKNIREWIYPNRSEIKDLIRKAITSNSLPVLVARRLPYVTFRLLQTCGVMLFENFNQLYPAADATLATDVRGKHLLGYHDVRAGNAPNKNLSDFLAQTIVRRADEYRERFERYRDLLEQFADGDLYYAAFAARVRRREQGTPEDSDEPMTPESVDPNDWNDF